MILDVIRAHPLVIFDGAVCANHYYVPRRESLRGNQAEHEVTRLLGSLRERERAEEKVRETNARFALVLNSITDHFFAFSRDWRFTYMNKHAAAQLRRLGKDPEQIIGKVLWNEFAKVPNEASMRRAMFERVPVIDELYYPPLGEWVENHWYPSEDGGLVTYQRYVTERKRSEAALRRSEAQLAEGQKISHNGTWSWNAASGELFWSAEHFRIWGLDPAQSHPTAAEAVGMAHPEDQARMWRVWEEAIGAGKEYACEFRVVQPNGAIRHVQSLGQPVLDSAGGLVEYIGTVMDVTERKRAAEDLFKAREDLARVNRILTVGELTASIAHELNQPLAAVMINANACERWLAAEPPNLSEANDALRHISRDANRASEVISRIRALLMKSSTRRVDLRIDEVIRDVASLVQGQVAAHGVTMLVDIEPELPRLLADRVQLQQLILNLILNAVESMSAVPGKRVLNVRAARREPGEVLVSVRDTGTGVDPRHIEQVFDPFFTTKADGMGMGLAISRSIVEAHRGRLWAVHNDGPGATFLFTLPASPQP
jgi:signal transduction histidine kinase